MEKDRVIAIDRFGLPSAWMNDEKALHAHGDLGRFIGMGVVHECAVLDQREFILEGFSRIDIGLSQTAYPIHAVGEKETMPMNGSGFRQIIGDQYAHPITLHRFDCRSGGLAIVTPAIDFESGGEFTRDHLRDEMEYLDIPIHFIGQG